MFRHRAVFKHIRLTKREVYRFILLLIFCLVILWMSYQKLRESDYYSVTSGEAEFEQVYLYPGSYELTIDAGTSDPGASFTVLDRWSNTVIAEHEYTPGEEYHTVRFTTDQIYQDVVVNSHADKITVYGYTLQSDGPVCQDAKIILVLFLQLAVMIWAGLRKAGKGKPGFLAVTVLCASASLPFLTSYLPTGHDICFHLARIASLGISLGRGLIPERLNLTLGGTGITPIMYPEMGLLGSGLIVAAGGTVFLAYKALCVFITFLTGYVAYYSGREALGEKTGIVFAALYVLNPFRLNELFVRAAVGEAFAIAFLPLVALGLWQMLRNDWRRGIWEFAAGVTGLLSSHIVTTVITAVFCILYLIALFLLHPIRFIRNLRRVGAVLLSGALIVLCNLWFLLPFLSFVGMKTEIAENAPVADIGQSAPFLWQIFSDTGPYGGNNVTASARGEMPLTIGTAVLITSVLFLLFKLYIVRTKADRQSCQGQRLVLQEQEKEIGDTTILFGWIAVYMSSTLFPWNEWCQYGWFDSTLGKIQFTWRILGFAAFFLSVNAAVVLRRLYCSEKKIPQMIAVIILTLVMVTAIHAGTEYIQNPDLMDGKYDYPPSTNYDYILSDVYKNRIKVIDGWIRKGKPPAAHQRHSEGLTITDYRRDGADYAFSFEKNEDREMTVTVPVFDYGFHRAVLVPGADAGSEETMKETDVQNLQTSVNEDLEFTDVVIPKGIKSGTVRLIYSEPFAYKIVDYVSAVSWIFLTAYLLIRRFRRDLAYKNGQTAVEKVVDKAVGEE